MGPREGSLTSAWPRACATASSPSTLLARASAWSCLSGPFLTASASAHASSGLSAACERSSDSSERRASTALGPLGKGAHRDVGKGLEQALCGPRLGMVEGVSGRKLSQ
jgi:hypothetical protein